MMQPFRSCSRFGGRFFHALRAFPSAFLPLLAAAFCAGAGAGGAAHAANLYVSQSLGSDSNPGTEARPWKTLSKATATAVAGDSVLVMPGTYSDPASDPFRAFNPANSGRAGAPIVFKSQRLHEAILTNPNRNHPAFGVNTRSYIVIDGFKVLGGIGFRDRADNGVIRNCDVSRGFIQEGDVSLDWGIYLGGASRCLIENNYIHAPAGYGNKTHNGAAIMVIGVPAPCDNNVIRNNEADGGNLWYNAFGQKAGNISNNTWIHNVARNAVCGFMGMGSTDNARYSTANLFQENLILNCKYAFELDHHSTKFRIQGNTAKDCGIFLYGGYRPDVQSGISGTEVWNNIFLPPAGSGAFYGRDVSAPGWKAMLAYSDYNLMVGKPAIFNYASGSIATLPDWRAATGFDAHSVAGNPVFVDASKGDFHLAAASPAQHAGIDRLSTSPGYGGLPPDMGIYPRPPENAALGYSWSARPVETAKPTQPRNLGPRQYDPIPD